jgi:hypothetical protein
MAFTNASLQHSSECLAALSAKPNQKEGWLSRKAASLAQAVVENLIFRIENVSIKFREFEFCIDSMLFEPTKLASDAKFTKSGSIAGLVIRCSDACAVGSDAAPVLELRAIEFTLNKGSSGAYTMHLHSGTVAVEAQPTVLKLGLGALSGLPLSSFV